jgi:hypothetical protein
MKLKKYKHDPGNNVARIAVFDMDETLGSFADLSNFVYTLARVAKHIHSDPDKLIQDNFNSIMDLYPEVLRPKIMDIMALLVEMKKQHKCKHVMIYTNNTGPREWIDGIKNYFNYKSGYPLFDRVIGAFKRPNGEIVEFKRTSHDKTYNDLVRCSSLEGNFEIFFVDDRVHPGMHTENVYVIEVKPYERNIPKYVFVDRFMKSPLFTSLGFSSSAHAVSKLKNIVSKHETDFSVDPNGDASLKYDDDEMEVDLLVGETILEKVKWFFNQPFHKYGRVKKSIRKRDDVKRLRRTKKNQ